MSYEYLQQLVDEYGKTYGYYLLFFGTLLEGETIMVLAGMAAKAGILDLWWVIPIGFAGSLTGDQTLFFVSRYFFSRGKFQDFLLKRPAWQPRIDRINRILERHGTWFILSFRFYYGLRNITPVVIAASSVKSSRFVLLNVTGAILWAVAVASAGYLFGHAVEVAAFKLKTVLVVLVGAALLAWVIRHLYLRYRAKRSVCVIKTPDRPSD
jgi:membrane protein DedA with SNARE-associated domain